METEKDETVADLGPAYLRLQCLALAKDIEPHNALKVAADFLAFVQGETASPAPDFLSATNAPGADRGWPAKTTAADKCVNQLYVGESTGDGNLEFTRNDGVASIRIGRWLEPTDAVRLEGLLRDFLEGITARQAERAMAEQKASMAMHFSRFGNNADLTRA